MYLLTTESHKAKMGLDYGYLNAILYMSPGNISGYELCPDRTDGCFFPCLGVASGHAAIIKAGETTNAVLEARKARARWFMTGRVMFLKQLRNEIGLALKKARRLGLKLCVRLNGSTDIGWHGVRLENGNSIYQEFPDIQFVEYTKSFSRMQAYLRGKMPPNVHMTFSWSGQNKEQCERVLALGGNVAVIFDHFPKRFMGYEVVNGDYSDLRHLDPKGVVVGLKPKGRRIWNDTTGFLVRSRLDHDALEADYIAASGQWVASMGI
jgi:hypothetical protein